MTKSEKTFELAERCMVAIITAIHQDPAAYSELLQSATEKNMVLTDEVAMRAMEFAKALTKHIPE